MNKRLLLVASLVGALGIAGVTWGVSSSPSPRPVAIMRQARPITSETADIAISDDSSDITENQVIQLLEDVGEYGDRIQNTIKAGDWQQAQADLTRLQQSAQQLSEQWPSSNSDIQMLNASIEQLKQAVMSQDQQLAQQATNQLTLLTSQLNAQMTVPTSRTVNEQHSTEAVSAVK